MKKITLLLVLLLAGVSVGYSQCIRTSKYPFGTVVSNNLGLPQLIVTNNYTSEYSSVEGIIIGETYTFTCTKTVGGISRYITITDAQDNVLAMGDSPLTVEGITASEIKMHYSNDAACASESENHTTTLQIILACPPPMGITVSDITTTSATFSWEIGGAETAWEVLVLPADSVAPSSETSGTAVSGAPTYTYTQLQPAMNYVVYVRSNCGSEFSPWTLPLYFASGCEAIAAFNENFDNSDELPVCWTSLIRGATVSEYANIYVSGNGIQTEPNGVVLYNEDSNTDGSDDIILITPNLSSLAGSNNNRLKFYASGSDNIQIGTLDNTTAEAVFTPYQEVEINNTPTSYAVDFSGYTGSDTFIGIRMNTSDSYTSVYLDNILWEINPTCPDVTDITVPMIGTDGATIAWNAGGSETGWNVAVSDNSSDDPNDLTFVTSTETSKEITGLNPETNYFVWVRATCPADDNGAWIGPIAFKTDCLPVATFNENFDASFDFPSCWSRIIRGETVSQWASIGVYQWESVHSAPYAMRLSNDNSDTTGEDDVILVSPNLSSLGLGTHRVKFFAKGSGSLQLGTLDANTNAAIFSAAQEIVVSETPTEYTVDFTFYTGTDKYIAFRMNSEIYSNIYIDDVRWELAPTCADVTEINVPVVGTDSATVTWINNGGESLWHIAVGTSEDIDPDALPFQTATDPTKDLSGLQDASNYQVWVRSVCPGNDFGVWIGPVAFTTECLPIATFSEDFDSANVPELPTCWKSIIRGNTVSEYAYVQTTNPFQTVNSGPNAVEMYNSSSDTDDGDDIILVSPSVSTLDGGLYRLKFYARGEGSLQIGTLDGTTSDAVFTLVEEVATTDITTEYAVNIVSPTTDTFIGIRMNNSDTYSNVYLDDIRWELAPTCPDVVNIIVDGLTTSTANVSWQIGGGEPSWQTVYGLSTETDPTTLSPGAIVNDPSAQLTGLESGTTYNVWVRSVCPNNDFGGWIGPVTFTSACEPTAISSVGLQGFEDTADNALPVCWSFEIVENSGNAIWSTRNPDSQGGDIPEAHSGDRIAYKDYNNSDALLYSLPLDYTSVTGATRINTFLYRQENGHETDKYTIYVNTTASLEGAEMLFELYSKTTEAPAVSDSGWYNYLIDIPESFNGEPQLYVIVQGFTSQGFQSYALGMDDFTIEATPAMGTPDAMKNDFKFYPNPVKDVLHINYTEAISNVAVFNLLGQKVIDNSMDTTNANVDLSALSTGNYIVKVTSGGAIKTMKILKQ